MDRTQIERAVRAVLSRMDAGGHDAPGEAIPVEVSARHVHLSKADLKALFGIEELPRVRDISQPGQYLSDKRVRLIGPKGVLGDVAVLGPTRGATQVEVSMTDARALGIAAPVRLSGDLSGAAKVFLQAGDVMIEAHAAIVAARHLHLPVADARRMGLADHQRVCVRVEGARPATYEDVIVRAVDPSAPRLHIDTDEANAAGVGRDTLCRIVNCGAVEKLSPVAAPVAEAHAFEEKLLTEYAARQLVERGVKRIALKKGQIITPLARDVLKYGGVELM